MSVIYNNSISEINSLSREALSIKRHQETVLLSGSGKLGDLTGNPIIPVDLNGRGISCCVILDVITKGPPTIDVGLDFGFLSAAGGNPVWSTVVEVFDTIDATGQFFYFIDPRVPANPGLLNNGTLRVPLPAMMRFNLTPSDPGLAYEVNQYVQWTE